MDFLGIGPLELLFILLIVIVVLGPRDIARTGRTMGQWLNHLYKSEGWKTLTMASREIRNLPNRLAREAELADLEELRELKELSRLKIGPGNSPSPETASGAPRPTAYPSSSGQPATVSDSASSEASPAEGSESRDLAGGYPADGDSEKPDPMAAWVRPPAGAKPSPPEHEEGRRKKEEGSSPSAQNTK